MKNFSLIPILLFATLVGGYDRYRSEQFEDYNELTDSEPPVERQEYMHVIGIEPFLRVHADDPLALFDMFYDASEDDYEDIALPRRMGDSIVKIRKPKLRLLPKVKEHLLAYLRKKNIPELNNYIEQHHLDQED